MAASLIINSPYIAPARRWRQARNGSLALTGAALAVWVQAVNTKGGFGVWCWDVAFKPTQIQDIPGQH